MIQGINAVQLWKLGRIIPRCGMGLVLKTVVFSDDFERQKYGDSYYSWWKGKMSNG